MNVDEQVMDYATWPRHTNNRNPPDQGGFHVTCSNFQGTDALSQPAIAYWWDPPDGSTTQKSRRYAIWTHPMSPLSEELPPRPKW